MAKTLTAKTEEARQRTWAEVIPLLELTLWRDRFGSAPASTIVRLSDQDRTLLGQDWRGLAFAWGPFRHGLGEGSSLDVQLDNTLSVSGVTRFTDLVRSGLNAGGYDIPMSDATLYLLFRGGASGDELKIARLLCEEITGANELQATLRMSGVELFLDVQDGAALDPTPIITCSQGAGSAGQQVFSWTMCAAGGVDRVLVVGVGVQQVGGGAPDDLVTGITYGGTPLALAKRQTPSGTPKTVTDLWYLLNPAPGAHSIEVTLTSGLNAAALGVHLANIIQGTPSGVVGYNGNYPPTLTLTGSGSVLSLDAFSISAPGLSGLAPNAGQTQIGQINSGGGSPQCVLAMSSREGLLPLTLGWTFSHSDTSGWPYVAAYVIP